MLYALFIFCFRHIIEFILENKVVVESETKRSEWNVASPAQVPGIGVPKGKLYLQSLGVDAT